MSLTYSIILDKSRSTAASSTRFVLVIETVAELDVCLNYYEKTELGSIPGVLIFKMDFLFLK